MSVIPPKSEQDEKSRSSLVLDLQPYKTKSAVADDQPKKRVRRSKKERKARASQSSEN